ncbi:MAG: hypothetical protein HYX24_01385 [Candidatus Aenigmarchaeota archaeon]|nr:hypothetical protein [Candidatus Aenigmarchaeota archaeon]
MSGKTVYVFAEDYGCERSCFCIYIGGAVLGYSPQEMARNIRNLRKSGYTIADSSMPSNVPMRGQYRELDEEERESLATLVAKLARLERHPGLSLEELERLEDFRERGIKQGRIWVDDMELYTPEMLESAARLTGEAPYPPPQTQYCLHADGNPYAVGRRRVHEFAKALKFFNSAMTLRNALAEEAKGLSLAGRPLTDEELKELVREGVEIETG